MPRACQGNDSLNCASHSTIVTAGYSFRHPEDWLGTLWPSSWALATGHGDGFCSEPAGVGPGWPSTVLQPCQSPSPLSVCGSLPGGLHLSLGQVRKCTCQCNEAHMYPARTQC